MSSSAGLVLHGYWRSGTSYRVRLALALKGVPYAQAPVDLRAGDQRSDAYRALNPQGLAPALELADGAVLIQSPAILEWLEERHPDPPLLPDGPEARAVVRAMAAVVACDVHPLNNLRVLDALRARGADAADVAAWAARWIADGFAALEAMVARHGDGFAYGDRPTLADCHLLPQIYSARRFGVDLGPYPRLAAAGERLAALPEVRGAHPEAQPDADSPMTAR